MRKPDEMERHHNYVACRNAFVFYSIVLLIWSFWSFIETREVGWEFITLLIGVAVFWFTRLFLARKTG
ncbi:hypothetical protein SAMN05216244_0857 [Sediminibacillus halophilus]|uniref:Uncharacterized protein n=1 Tax=Sediminibacillus halophilus TaxID=482461 RepID=A0A1G9N576_9BACI|nr:hypothetical protein SAMN05216244_0857 [Sediminibacillus halophilus]